VSLHDIGDRVTIGVVVRAVLASVVLFGCNQVLGLEPTIEVDAPLPVDADTRPDLDPAIEIDALSF
jgi:hypothetical protein